MYRACKSFKQSKNDSDTPASVGAHRTWIVKNQCHQRSSVVEFFCCESPGQGARPYQLRQLGKILREYAVMLDLWTYLADGRCAFCKGWLLLSGDRKSSACAAAALRRSQLGLRPIVIVRASLPYP
jgi:hypothetical protein